MSIASPDPYEPITEGQWAQIRASWPNTQRLHTAWRLALDLETLDDLLAGRPVDPTRIDPGELARARRASLVQLVRPIDTLLQADVA
jgi:hypothetical protein